jgi:hypothetical protein
MRTHYGNPLPRRKSSASKNTSAQVAQGWLGELPSFCEPIFDDRSSSVVWIDFWAVEASGDVAADQARGERYADEAIRYSREIDQPEFVDCVIAWITYFCHAQGREMHELGPIEKAFIAHAIRKDPPCVDRMIVRFAPLLPQLRN